MKKFRFKYINIMMALALSFQGFLPSISLAQGLSLLNLPSVGTMVTSSPVFTPSLIKGIVLNADNPLAFDFVIHYGDESLTEPEHLAESTKMIKYFLTALTVPEDELWVNLSPIEKERMIPEGLSKTKMGRDLLAQDYLLKQLTASMINPEEKLGQTFWEGLYKKISQKYGHRNIPVDTFHKIWIVPQEAVVMEEGRGAFVMKSRLGVKLEEDYKAQDDSQLSVERKSASKDTVNLSTDLMRSVILPEIEREVNEGEHFAKLRQIYNALILAAWYKQKLKTVAEDQSYLAKVYVDQNKIKGDEVEDQDITNKIYQRYLKALNVGVYDYIKEDLDPLTAEMIPRKYFSGGTTFFSVSPMLVVGIAATLIASQVIGFDGLSDIYQYLSGAAEEIGHIIQANFVGFSPDNEAFLASASAGMGVFGSTQGKDDVVKVKLPTDVSDVEKLFKELKEIISKKGIKWGYTMFPGSANKKVKVKYISNKKLLVIDGKGKYSFRILKNGYFIITKRKTKAVNFVIPSSGEYIFIKSLLQDGFIRIQNANINLPGIYKALVDIGINNPESLDLGLKSMSVVNTEVDDQEAAPFKDSQAVIKKLNKMKKQGKLPEIYNNEGQKFNNDGVGSPHTVYDSSAVNFDENDKDFFDGAYIIYYENELVFVITKDGAIEMIEDDGHKKIDLSSEEAKPLQEVLKVIFKYSDSDDKAKLLQKALDVILADTDIDLNVVDPNAKGGIDFNFDQLDLQIKRNGAGVPLPMSQQPFETMRIEGMLPVIINVLPLSDLPLLLGLNLENTPIPIDQNEHQKNRLETISTLPLKQRKYLFRSLLS